MIKTVIKMPVSLPKCLLLLTVYTVSLQKAEAGTPPPRETPGGKGNLSKQFPPTVDQRRIRYTLRFGDSIMQ